MPLCGSFSLFQVSTVRMQGVMLMVFARYYHLPFLQDIQTDCTRTGLGGYWVSVDKGRENKSYSAHHSNCPPGPDGNNWGGLLPSSRSACPLPELLVDHFVKEDGLGDPSV